MGAKQAKLDRTESGRYLSNHSNTSDGYPADGNEEVPSVTYGGSYPWTGVHYKMKVAPGASPLQWLNALTKKLLVLEDISLAEDGTFQRPQDSSWGIGTPMFPRRGIDVRWRWDERMSCIVIDFWQNDKFMEWRWDELRPITDMTLRADTEAPDLAGLGHVGKLTFNYQLLRQRSAETPSSSFGSNGVDAAQTLFLNLEPVTREGKTFDFWMNGFKVQLTHSGYDGLGGAFARPPPETELGEGSFGVVWLARNRKTGDFVAVKNMRTKIGDLGRAVAQNEFGVVDKIIAQPHPCIVTFFGLESFTIPRGELFMLAMEFCPGGDVQEALCKCASKTTKDYTPPAEALLWIGQMFLAIEHIHTVLKLLIRDLKPHNVILDKNRCAKLADFGCGRLVAESDGGAWTFRSPPGTPGYASPETLKQEPYSYPCDIYSFGVVAWVILSGGCKLRQMPGPPTRGFGKRGDFSVFANDWKLLEECLLNQSKARCPIDAQAVELLSTMVQITPSDRPDCAAIRNSKFFQERILTKLEAYLPATLSSPSQSSEKVEESSEKVELDPESSEKVENSEKVDRYAPLTSFRSEQVEGEVDPVCAEADTAAGQGQS